MSSARNRRALAAALACGVLGLVAIPSAIATFSARAESSGDVVTAAPDFVAPVVDATAIGKTLGGVTGFVKPGGSYYVYANVGADTGNPPSGIATVTANAEALTSGAAAVPLVAGTYSAGGAGFNYRSAALAVGAAVTAGVKSFAITATDNAGNARTAPGTVVVDNVIPTAADVQTTNAAGGANGLPEQGDTVVYTFSEPIEPESILAGWSGATTNVVVRIYDNGLAGLLGGNDSLVVYNAANAAQLPLGTIDLGRGDYATGLLANPFTFGTSGTASTMTMSGNAVTIVLGTYAAPTLSVRATALGTGTMIWTPSSTPYDRAGNGASTAPATESGAADRDF